MRRVASSLLYWSSGDLPMIALPHPKVTMNHGHTYDPVGVCIYCGAMVTRLSEEHIIPQGLGGTLKLPAASCSVCADETHAYEGRVQARMFGYARAQFGIRGKKRDKHR